MKWYIIRHGQTWYSKRDVDYGEQVFDASILEESIPVIEQIGNYLKSVDSSINFSSEFKRCRQTVEILEKETGKKFSFDKRLNEFHNETFSDLRKRVDDFISEMKEKKADNILVCTHGAVISALRHLLKTGDYNPPDLVDFPPTGTIILIDEKKDEKILRFDEKGLQHS